MRQFNRFWAKHVPGIAPTAVYPVDAKRFFAEITRKRIRRGSFRSVEELEQAIKDYLRIHNQKPKPFVWTKDADLILRKVKRACERLAPPEN